MTDSAVEYERIKKLTVAVGRQLTGHPPELQGMALVQAVAIYLQGFHAASDDPGETRSVQRATLDLMIEAIWSIVNRSD